MTFKLIKNQNIHFASMSTNRDLGKITDDGAINLFEGMKLPLKKLTPFASSLSYHFIDKSKNHEEWGWGQVS